MRTITIIVPTLNEAENIDLLLTRIFNVRRSSKLDFDILFVDSASTDGTCARVLDWQQREPVLLLQHDVNVGLAGAVIAGARYTATCTCRYVHFADRRSGKDRRSVYDWTRERQLGVVNRRAARGRRATDAIA